MLKPERPLTVAVQIPHDGPGGALPNDRDCRVLAMPYRKDVERKRITDSPIVRKRHDPLGLVERPGKMMLQGILTPALDVGVLRVRASA
jgi:hypothetical protein